MKSLNIDIFDFNMAFDERMAFLSLPPQALPRPGIVIRIIAFFWHLLEGLLHVNIPLIASRIPKGSILFFVYTKNQKDALEPVKERTQSGYFVGYNVSVDRYFPVFLAHILAIPFLPLVLLQFSRALGYRRKTFRYNFDQYWLTYGYHIVARIWLKQIAPRALVLSNDHNMPNRVVTDVARKMRVPTIYIQHASVTNKFPPLSFDYALLEGRDALLKYDRAGPAQTTVFLIGIPKTDSYLKQANHSSRVRTVGICTGVSDPFSRVDVLCKHIQNNFPNISIVIRPHPRDKRYVDWIKLAKSHQVLFSDSQVELSFEFLKHVDAIIAGDSNILLEAAIVNVYPIYYDFRKQAHDHYGFVRNGLAKYTSEPYQVSNTLQTIVASKPNVQMRTRIYCATMGTKYMGRSRILAKDLIQSIAQRSTIDLSEWRRIPSLNLEAYEPIY